MTLSNAFKTYNYYYRIFLKPAAARQRVVAQSRKMGHLLSRHARPQSLELGLTYQCQLSCQHCGVAGLNDATRPEMRQEQFTRIIDEAAKLGVYLLVCGGGEPLLYEQLEAVVEHARQRGMIVGISTNGWELTAERAVRLRRRGTVFVNVSIDSPHAAVHDRNRGRAQSFQRALAAVQACRDAGISTIVSTCVTKDMLAQETLPELIGLARKIGAHGVRLLFPVPAGKWLGCGPAALTDQEQAQVKALLDPVYVYVEGVCNKFTECNALLKKLLYISPYGDVQPCSFVPLSFGNVCHEPLRLIWERMIAHQVYRLADSRDCMMRDDRVRPYVDTDAPQSTEYPLRLSRPEGERAVRARL